MSGVFRGKDLLLFQCRPPSPSITVTAVHGEQGETGMKNELVKDEMLLLQMLVTGNICCCFTEMKGTPVKWKYMTLDSKINIFILTRDRVPE